MANHSHDEHHQAHETTPDRKLKLSSASAFWFFAILAGLFIASVNFVKIMSADTGGHGAHATEATHDAGTSHDAAHDAHGTTETVTHEAATTDSTHATTNETTESGHEGHGH